MNHKFLILVTVGFAALFFGCENTLKSDTDPVNPAPSLVVEESGDTITVPPPDNPVVPPVDDGNGNDPDTITPPPPEPPVDPPQPTDKLLPECFYISKNILFEKFESAYTWADYRMVACVPDKQPFKVLLKGGSWMSSDYSNAGIIDGWQPSAYDYATQSQWFYATFNPQNTQPVEVLDMHFRFTSGGDITVETYLNDAPEPLYIKHISVEQVDSGRVYVDCDKTVFNF
ncbi:MAG: hypothetical protein LBS01_04880 [Prevotellaceae bacterium]|jgi:hypothetical protein|nr:hypothetical protein [Prevotellaceae bacterium]